MRHVYTESDFLSDCRADGARDYDNVGDSLPTVEELIAEQAEVWIRDQIGAEFGRAVQMDGLREWAEAWHARGVRCQIADALRAVDYAN